MKKRMLSKILKSKNSLFVLSVVLTQQAFASGNLFNGAEANVTSNMTSMRNLLCKGIIGIGALIAIVGGMKIAIAQSSENPESQAKGIQNLLTGLAIGAVGVAGLTLKIS